MGNEKKRVLVTGGNGLVGNAIKSVAPLFPEFSFIYSTHKDDDLTDNYEAYDLIDYAKANYIVHAAARVGGIGKNLSSPAEQFSDNILVNTNMVKYAHGHQVEKFIAFGSVCAFPHDAEVLTEANYLTGEPFPAHKSYAWAKRMMNVQLEAYRQQYGFNSCVLLPTNLFGEHDNYNLTDGHVVPSLIHKFYNATRDKTPVEIWGDGSPLREFVYAQDLAKIVLTLLRRETLPTSLIVPGQELSICELVKKINMTFMKVYSEPDQMFTLQVKYDTTKPNGQTKRPTDRTLFNRTFPDFEFTSLDDALVESVKWFRFNYEKARK